MLITYVRELTDKEGVYWLVVDSEAARGAQQSYLQGDRWGEGMKLLYTQIAGEVTSQSKAAINIIATPSHWITRANIAADKAASSPAETSLRWILRKHFTVVQQHKFRDQYQLMPGNLVRWMQQQGPASTLSDLHREQFGEEYKEIPGLPLDVNTAAPHRPNADE